MRNSLDFISQKNGFTDKDNNEAVSLISVFFLSWEIVSPSMSRSFPLPGGREAASEPSGPKGLCL